MINYLSRLGWSHGDDEIFTTEQFLSWFDLDHLGRSAAQFDEAKLKWVNAQHMKRLPAEELAKVVVPFLKNASALEPSKVVALAQLFKDRCDTLVDLAQWIDRFYDPVQADPLEYSKHVNELSIPSLRSLSAKLQSIDWDVAHIAAALKEVLTEQGLKMPQLAMPVRVLLLGTAQTPSLDQVMALFDKKVVLERLSKV